MGSHFRWDDPVFNNGDYFKFVNKGDQIAGTIEEITTFKFDDKEENGVLKVGQTVPQLKLRVAKDQLVTVTCSNAHLLEKVRSLAPQLGDSIDITYVDDATTNRGGKKKMFLVKVTKPVAQPQVAEQEEPPF